MPPHPNRRYKRKFIRTGRSKIFLVHGHDHGLRETVARFLEGLGCELVILHEMPNKGSTVFQKFTTYSDVEFAVVLLTADDIGGSKSTGLALQKTRARQNVILELGFFLGSLGADKVCSLYEEGVELPSDYHGVMYIPLHDKNWKTALAKELNAANIRIDTKHLLNL